jgi:hypothetical protein
MRNVNNIDWKRVLLEGAVIVISILLAFWIDAWWNQREEDERVDSLLFALEKEWSENLGDLEKTISHLDRYIAFTARRINASLQDIDSLRADELKEILEWSPSEYRRFDPSTGAWNAVILVALSNIDDVELSSAIAAWSGRLDGLTNLREALDLISDTESGRIYTRLAQSHGVAIDPETGDYRFDSDEERVAFERTILRDEERIRSWRMAARAARVYHDKLKAVRDELESDLELLRTALDD